MKTIIDELMGFTGDCFFYYRLSEKDKHLKKEERAKSLINQEKEGLEFAKKYNLNIVGIFKDEYISGAYMKTRKDFMRMLDIISKEYGKGKKPLLIIVPIRARLFRNPAHFFTEMGNLKSKEIQIFSIEQFRYISVDNVEDMFGCVVDYLYIKDLREKRISMENNYTERNLAFTPPSFGYIWKPNQKEGEDKVWVIDKLKAQKVIEEDKDIKNEVNWRITCKRLNLTKKQYYKIKWNIEKEIYKGFVAFKKKVKDVEGEVTDNEIIKYKGNHPPIL